MITTADAAEFAWSDFPRAELHALACRRRGGAWAGELEAAWLAVQADGWTPLRAAVATCGLIFGDAGAHPRDLTSAVRRPPVTAASVPPTAEFRRSLDSLARRAAAAKIDRHTREAASLCAAQQTTPRPWGRLGVPRGLL